MWDEAGGDPMDAWLERMDRPMDEFDISTEDYLGVVQSRVQLEEIRAC